MSDPATFLVLVGIAIRVVVAPTFDPRAGAGSLRPESARLLAWFMVALEELAALLVLAGITVAVLEQLI